MMAKYPAVLFYTSDFISGTLTMTDEQRGKYIILLCLQHQQGKLSKEDMLNICQTYDSKIFAKFETDSDEMFFNKRMDEEIKKRKSYSDSRRKNRSGKKKKSNKTSKTYVPHMEDENENKDINVIKVDNILILPFDEIGFINVWNDWKDYKKQQHKFTYKGDKSEQAALKKLGDMSNGSLEYALEIVFYSMAQGYKGLYEPDNKDRKPKSIIQGFSESYQEALKYL